MLLQVVCVGLRYTYRSEVVVGEVLVLVEVEVEELVILIIIFGMMTDTFKLGYDVYNI